MQNKIIGVTWYVKQQCQPSCANPFLPSVLTKRSYIPQKWPCWCWWTYILHILGNHTPDCAQYTDDYLSIQSPCRYYIFRNGKSRRLILCLVGKYHTDRSDRWILSDRRPKAYMCRNNNVLPSLHNFGISGQLAESPSIACRTCF